jgi:hypothetical protein
MSQTFQIGDLIRIKNNLEHVAKNFSFIIASYPTAYYRITSEAICLVVDVHRVRDDWKVIEYVVLVDSVLLRMGGNWAESEMEKV